MRVASFSQEKLASTFPLQTHFLKLQGPFVLSMIAVANATTVSSQDTNREPNLPFGDINLVVLTDDHSWIGGHGRKEPYFNADYGDILSFYQHLKRYCDANGKDLWFVMNGDWIDGTALSLDGDIQYLAPLIEKMPFDVVNTGNHELYKTRVIQEMRRAGGFLDWWGNHHLASNIVMTESGNPLSNRFVVLEGKFSHVLVFGFIYHLENPAPEVTVLDPVEVVEETWFIDALRDNPHAAVLVMAHMGTDDEAVQPILDAIRRWDGEHMPVQFVAGHTHLRRWSRLDEFASAVEAGRFLDTIGFISFPNADTVARGEQGEDANDLFLHEFVDANVDLMKVYLQRDDDFTTSDGRALTAYIRRTKSKMGLDKVLGCSSIDYFMNRSLEEHDSLWAIYRDKVVPSQLEQKHGVNRAIFISQASWRYDLLAGENTYDDIVAVSPFNEPVFYVGTLPCDAVLSLNNTMNRNMTDNFYQVLPAYILSGTVKPGEDCELYTHHFELELILDNLSTLSPQIHFDAQTTEMTSTTIWTNFFLSEWPCESHNDSNIVHGYGRINKKDLSILVASTVMLTVIYCWLTQVCWRKTAYTQPTMVDEVDTYDDEVTTVSNSHRPGYGSD